MQHNTSGYILGLIPARGGSKGIPRKNVRHLAGKPLIHYSCKCACESKWITRTIVSTDDSEIALVAQRENIEVPFIRPSALAADATPTVEVVQHTLNWLQDHEGEHPEIIVLLQPTAPLRQSQHVDEAVDLLLQGDADSVVSVTEIPAHYNPHWQFTVANGRLCVFTGEQLSDLVPRRQALPTTYTRNGAIYALRRRALELTDSMYGRSCVPYVMPPELSINIDTPSDWQAAEIALQKQEVSRAAS